MSLQNDTTTAPPSLSDAFARWKQTVEGELKGADFDKKLVTRTFEGVALQPLYTRNDLRGVANLDSAPGAAPYSRGVRALGYRERGWEIAQEIAARTPTEFNTALSADLMTGQNCVVLTPDLAARGGGVEIEPAAGVPPIGLALTDLRSLNTALRGVDLTAVPIHLRAGADPLPLAALLLVLARSNQVPWESLTGSVAADPLGHWAETGRLAGGLPATCDSLAGWTNWAATHAPGLQTIGVNAALWGHAGATGVQELAFALASAAEYLRELQLRGVDADIAATRVRFELAIGPQFFTEIAKFRALRPLWARVVGAFGAPMPAAGRATVHAATGRWNKTLRDPHVNLLRATTEALSAVLGGCDSLHVAPFDEVSGKTDDFSRRIARNVHTLLAEEFGFTQTADPAGGSWYIEKLTDDLARKAWELFQDIERRGGMAAALREGFPHGLLAKAVAQKAEAVNKRRLGLVGTNLFPNLKEKPLSPADASRAADGHAAPALPLPPAGVGWPARFEAALAAAKTGATIAQLAHFSRPAGTSELVIPPVAPWRAAEAFEQLRSAADAWARVKGARPRVFLAKMGPSLQHKARADFATGFFAVAGFEVLGKQSFDTADGAAAAAVKSDARIVVLCSTDETYPVLVPAFAQIVKATDPSRTVVLAGLPADPAVLAAFTQAGVDEFIHIRADVHAILAKLLRKIGVLA